MPDVRDMPAPTAHPLPAAAIRLPEALRAPGGPALPGRDGLADGAAWGDAGDAHAELRTGLLDRQARIPPRYFYDDHGSALFEAITQTRDYYVTRVENQIMAKHLPAMARAITDALGSLSAVVEPGAGSCRKALPLCRELRAPRFVGLDVAADFMAEGAQRLRAALPAMAVHTLAADILQTLPLPPSVPRDGRLLFYPGSSIGNATPDEAVVLLRAMGQVAGHRGALLIGVDLVKSARTLERAYDDEQGVTAAFNRNVLRHVNRVLGADFEPGQWRHVALWNEAHQRIEMHLETVRPQQVRWDGGARRFKAGERILTEYSHKYTLDGFGRMLRAAGWTPHRVWTDERGAFAVVLAVP